ncbi:MAG TPA: MOSC N-terminal beta barrel domain-containing protein [Candidatus Limnocylindria bacterium]|jgi:uncharacterized protein YcbX|nr:MOSC N-terminal beta barrel domain-containing protein [Candidatus Limnocylindria bacterium]
MIAPIEITGLFTYPIKSCRAIQHASLALDAFGPVWDRRWMLVNPAGEFVTQRTFPKMTQIAVTVDATDLLVQAPGEPALPISLSKIRDAAQPVVVWKDTCQGWDEGDAAAEWFSRYLGSSLRLVRMADDFVRVANPKWVSFAAKVSFADGFPILLANEASLDDLNRRMEARQAKPVTMDRFRANLVIRGAPAWAEDHWKQIRVGNLVMDVVKPCTRCVITTTDQDSGKIPQVGEPLATLATFKRWENAVVFAQNLVHRGPGTLSVWDTVEVIG